MAYRNVYAHLKRVYDRLQVNLRPLEFFILLSGEYSDEQLSLIEIYAEGKDENHFTVPDNTLMNHVTLIIETSKRNANVARYLANAKEGRLQRWVKRQIHNGGEAFLLTLPVQLQWLAAKDRFSSGTGPLDERYLPLLRYALRRQTPEAYPQASVSILNWLSQADKVELALDLLEELPDIDDTFEALLTAVDTVTPQTHLEMQEIIRMKTYLSGRGEIPQGLWVLKAEYYSERNDNSINVGRILRRLIDNDTLKFPVENNVMGGDPDVGTLKQLTIDYAYQGRVRKLTVAEHTVVQLPRDEKNPT
jgi:hypothetical protein